MSAPRADLHHASLLSYGFLATRAENAARLMAEHKDLSAADKEALSEAADFLRKISKGADFLTDRKWQHQDLVGALDALSVAMDPIKALSSVFRDGRISEIFANTAETVSKHIENGGSTLTDDDMERLNIFRAFFNALYTYVSNELEQNTPVVGSASGRLRTV